MKQETCHHVSWEIIVKTIKCTWKSLTSCSGLTFVAHNLQYLSSEPMFNGWSLQKHQFDDYVSGRK